MTLFSNEVPVLCSSLKVKMTFHREEIGQKARLNWCHAQVEINRFPLIKGLFSIPGQVFQQPDQSQLHHHLLHHLLHPASGSYILLLWEAPAEAPKGRCELKVSKFRFCRGDYAFVVISKVGFSFELL